VGCRILDWGSLDDLYGNDGITVDGEMSHLRIREIIDELNTLGGMTAAHHALITELVATCLLSAGPKPPLTGAERTQRWRENNKKEASSDEVTSHVTDSCIDNNKTLQSKQKDTAPTVTKTSRGTRLPDDWRPSDRLWCWGLEKLAAPDLKFETAAMIDYFHAQSGQRGVKLDWGKTWKTWIREAVRRRERFKPKSNVVPYVPGAPKRTWAEIKAERDQERKSE
jgi:hypothetical protein